MRRRIWFRPLASLLALWLPLMVGQPRVLMQCPMHGVSELAGGGPGATVHSGMMHAHDGGAPSAHRGDHGPSHHHQGCNCIDGCCASAALQPPTPESFELATIAYREYGALPTAEALARPAPEFSQPYPTGPPRA